MDNRFDTIDRLREIFADTFNIEVPDARTDLVDEGVLDSFQFVELLLKLEGDFGFRMDIESIDLDDLRTLERLAVMVDRNREAANGAASRGHAGA